MKHIIEQIESEIKTLDKVRTELRLQTQTAFEAARVANASYEAAERKWQRLQHARTELLEFVAS